MSRRTAIALAAVAASLPSAASLPAAAQLPRNPDACFRPYGAQTPRPVECTFTYDGHTVFAVAVATIAPRELRPLSEAPLGGDEPWVHIEVVLPGTPETLLMFQTCPGSSSTIADRTIVNPLVPCINGGPGLAAPAGAELVCRVRGHGAGVFGCVTY